MITIIKAIATFIDAFILSWDKIREKLLKEKEESALKSKAKILEDKDKLLKAKTKDEVSNAIDSINSGE